MATQEYRNPSVFTDTVTFLGNLNFPSGTIGKTYSIDVELAEQGTAVAAIEKLLHAGRADGEIKGVEAFVVTAADDASREVDVDVQKSSGGGAFSSILDSAIQFTSSDTGLSPKSGTITDAEYEDGDVFKAVVTVAGASGNQAKGLHLTVTVAEDPA